MFALLAASARIEARTPLYRLGNLLTPLPEQRARLQVDLDTCQSPMSWRKKIAHDLRSALAQIEDVLGDLEQRVKADD